MDGGKDHERQTEISVEENKKKEQERKRRLLHRKRERDKWSGENGI